MVKFGQVVTELQRRHDFVRTDGTDGHTAHCDLDRDDTYLNDTHDTPSHCHLESCAVWSNLVQ